MLTKHFVIILVMQARLFIEMALVVHLVILPWFYNPMERQQEIIVNILAQMVNFYLKMELVLTAANLL